MKNSVLVVMWLCLSAVARADLIITEVMSSSTHTNTAANADWWELYNSGASAVDLTTYSWDDADAIAGTADFNGLTINAGQAIIICGETLGAEASWISVWGLSGVTVVNLGGTEFQSFSSGGDQIHVYDGSSVEVASLTFGAATAGYTFEWDTSGNSLDLSVNGENGAFQATSSGGGGPDVGSPGVAIPEPGTWVLLGLGGLVVVGRRFLTG